MSVAQKKTPSVYITEQNAFPNSVVQVPTGIAAFTGYTGKAMRDGEDLTGIPTRISSFADYVALFGEGPETCFTVADDGEALAVLPDSRFLLHQSIKFFFANGGADCWIVSVGGYKDGDAWKTKSADELIGALEKFETVAEPDILCVPDAVLLPDATEWANVAKAMLNQCGELQSRFAILDVFDGFKSRDHSSDSDVISGTNGFRAHLAGAADLKYGAAYYPWVHTVLLEATDIGLGNCKQPLRDMLAGKIAAEKDAASVSESPAAARNQQIDALAAQVRSADDDAEMAAAHQAAMVLSAGYKQVFNQALALLNLLPPAAGMAGVYALNDASTGVFKAPANMTLASVSRPTVDISSDEQEDLNAPVDGLAINPIRMFTGRGVLVWGTKTLDANSLDWRYINVRRMMTMLEQSIKAALEACVFEPNVSTTWVSVKSMIENFLTDMWKAGALAGSTAADAFDVSVGLGSTMTSDDILAGYMRVTVHLAVVRPAEFIVITFCQQMQTS